MSFLVRQIALKSDGSEIVRAATVEGAELTIGRDSSCGIHLHDLAVDPRHAVVRRLGDERLTIESIGEQPFELNGRSATRGEIELSAGAELGFGGHRIQVSRDSETGFPDFAVRRVEAVSESAGEHDLGSVYTLKGLLPGKRMSAWTFAILVLVAFLAFPVWSYLTYQPLALHKDARRPAGWHADMAWSSGHLSDAHAKLGGDCQACHVDAFVAVRDNACMTCHTDDAHQHIADRPGQTAVERLTLARGTPTGFAGLQRSVALLFNRPPGRCVECHTEHTGAGAMPATRQKFCTDCHAGMKTRLPDTTIGDAADFGTNHPEFRPAIVVDPAPEQPVLRRVAWTPALRENDGLKFTHKDHLSKTNGVAQMVLRRPRVYRGEGSLDCKDCHKLDSTGVRYEPVAMEKACQTCHSLTFDQVDGTFRTLPHGKPAQVVADLRAFYREGGPPRPANLSGLARRKPGDAAMQASAADYARAVRFYPTRSEQAIAAVFSKGGMCYDCHVVTRTGATATGGFAVENVAQNGRYYHSGWFSHKDHTRSDCVACHTKAPTSNDATDLLVPGMDGPGGCRTCHVGESGTHLTSVKVRDPVASCCAMCHAFHMDYGQPWEPASRRKRKAHIAEADRTPRRPGLPSQMALR